MMQSLRQNQYLRMFCLLGLILQFVLVAGHHHDGVRLQSSGGNATAAADQLSHSPLQPSGELPAPSHDDGGKDNCQICWSIAAAGTSAITATDILAAPRLIVSGYFQAAATPSEIRSHTASFQARAPPALQSS